MQLLTPYVCLNHAHSFTVLDFGCIEQMKCHLLELDFWSWVPALRFFVHAVPLDAPCNGFAGGVLDLLFLFCICLVALFFF